jgi:hypothetical protein
VTAGIIGGEGAAWDGGRHQTNGSGAGCPEDNAAEGTKCACALAAVRRGCATSCETSVTGEP